MKVFLFISVAAIVTNLASATKKGVIFCNFNYSILKLFSFGPLEGARSDTDDEEMRIIISEACLSPFEDNPEESSPVMVQLTSLPLQVVEGVMHMESLLLMAKAVEGTDEFTRACNRIHIEAQQAKGNRGYNLNGASKAVNTLVTRRPRKLQCLIGGSVGKIDTGYYISVALKALNQVLSITYVVSLLQVKFLFIYFGIANP